jgi:hypothetical protein
MFPLKGTAPTRLAQLVLTGSSLAVIAIALVWFTEQAFEL